MRPPVSAVGWVIGALLAAGPARAQAPAPPPLTLDECIRLSLEQRPKARAARAILAQRQPQHAEVQRLARAMGLLRPDLKVRQDQAALGVEMAAISLAMTEADVRFSVARMYVTVLYARSSRQLAEQAVKSLTELRTALSGRKIIGKLLPNVVPSLLELTAVPILQAEMRLVEAEKGEAVALAALRQAVGYDPARPLNIVAAPLPAPDTPPPTREDLLRLVQQRNPDLRRADLFEQIVWLEVDAQKKSRLARTVDTFAAAGDIHATPLPPEGTEQYRPAPMVPEMPTRLVGSCAARVRSAELYAVKAAESARGVRNLVNLQALDTLLSLHERRRKIELTEKWARARVGELSWLLDLSPGERPDEALKRSVLAIGALADLERLRFEALVELLELERMTLGGFSSGVERAIVPR